MQSYERLSSSGDPRGALSLSRSHEKPEIKPRMQLVIINCFPFYSLLSRYLIQESSQLFIFMLKFILGIDFHDPFLFHQNAYLIRMHVRLF